LEVDINYADTLVEQRLVFRKGQIIRKSYDTCFCSLTIKKDISCPANMLKIQYNIITIFLSYYAAVYSISSDLYISLGFILIYLGKFNFRWKHYSCSGRLIIFLKRFSEI